MYRKNKRAQQPLLLSDVHELPQRSLTYLKQSWAETFRREVFLRIPEDRFAVLYDPDPSRPNVPVNLLVGLDILKEWRGWSDEELYEHFLFDLQVRYALGCDNFGEDDPDIRTLYYFRHRVREHAQKTGENLWEVVFEHITDKQIEKLNVNTETQRMDSTQIMSNIADLSRLELLVGVIQRLHRILKEEDQAIHAELFQAYIKESAGQYSYRIKGKEAVWEHIQKVGEVLYDLLGKLAEGYGQEAIYKTAQRFFDENFKLVETQVQAKTNKEITPGCLQSLDDLEASYRAKGSRAYKGYVANLCETCDPGNPVQLITHVQVAPNRTSDIELMKEALPDLQERTDLNQLATDGGYVSPEIDQLCRENEIEHITTGLTGTLPDHQDGKQALSDFAMELDKDGQVIQATCPAGQPATIQLSTSGKSSKLIFTLETCHGCAFYQHDQCPTKMDQHKRIFYLTVPKDRAISSQRRRRFEQNKEEARALRTAIEATVFQVKHPFSDGKVKVRGLFRTTCVLIGSALATNLRRIHRYENDQQRGKYTSKKGKEAFSSLFSTAQKIFCAPFFGFIARSDARSNF